MNIEVKRTYEPRVKKNDALYIPIWVNDKGEVKEKGRLYNHLPEAIQKTIASLLTGSQAKEGAFLEVTTESGGVVACKLRKEWTSNELRRDLRAMVQKMKSTGRKTLVLNADDFGEDMRPTEVAYLATESVILAEYDFATEFKTKPKKGWPKVDTLRLYTTEPQKTIDREVEKATIVAEATNRCRTLANYPPELMTPEGLAQAAQDVAREVKSVKVTVFDEKKLKKEGMNAILAVGSGSDDPPRLIMLEYKGAKNDKTDLALLGKGITFDSGGLNVKVPSIHMWDMHMDMSGGAAVIGALYAIAKLKLPVNVTGFVPAAENMISGTSYHQRDIIKTYGGQTMEIGNTDAEGRVILADAIGYAKTKKPKLMVTIATLTGAAVVALGERHGGLFVKENQNLENALRSIGDNSDDPVWPLPLTKDNERDVEGTFADVINIHKNNSRYGGASTAAAFLSFFAGDQTFAHLDMAPKMTTLPEEDFLGKGASGFGVRYFVKLAENWNEVKKSLK